MKNKTSIDSRDRAILALYQMDTTLTAQHIGDQVGLSAAAVQRRLNHLRRSGVIQGQVAQVDSAAVGLAITVIVHVDIERESTEAIEQFKSAMQREPQVQQCWYTTGETDFVLVVKTTSMQAYESFTRRSFTDSAIVAKFTSYVVLGDVKTGLALNLAQ